MAEILTPELTFGNYIYGTSTDSATGLQRKTIWQAAAFPQSLFTGGQTGAWYDPSDLSSLFQDSAGTTPVTAGNQPVGKMLDKSGNGRDMLQGTAAMRPLLRVSGNIYYLDFDGVDDNMLAASFAIASGAGAYSHAAAARTTAAGVQSIFTASNALGQFIRTNVTTPEAIAFNNAATPFTDAGTAIVANTDYVFTQVMSGVLVEMFVNNASAGGTAVTGTPASVADALSIGLLVGGGQIMTGRFYGGISLSRAFTVSEQADVYTYLRAKAGI